jgi:hypothetical protein
MSAVDTVRVGLFVATPGVASHLLIGWPDRIGPDQWCNLSATVHDVADSITVVNQGSTLAGSHLTATLTATTTKKGGGSVAYSVFLASSVSPLP